jgi:hypothetical protein
MKKAMHFPHNYRIDEFGENNLFTMDIISNLKHKGSVLIKT